MKSKLDYLRKPSYWNCKMSPPPNHLCLNHTDFSECFVSWSRGSVLYAFPPLWLVAPRSVTQRNTFSILGHRVGQLGVLMAPLHSTFSKPLIFPLLDDIESIGHWWVLYWHCIRMRKNFKEDSVASILAGCFQIGWNFVACCIDSSLNQNYTLTLYIYSKFFDWLLPTYRLIIGR